MCFAQRGNGKRIRRPRDDLKRIQIRLDQLVLDSEEAFGQFAVYAHALYRTRFRHDGVALRQSRVVVQVASPVRQ